VADHTSDYRMWIPFVNRRDLLAKAIASAADLHSCLTIIDNSQEGLEGDAGWPPIIRPPVPLSCSQTFNFIMRMTRQLGAHICIWMHNDAEAGEGVCAGLLEEARRLTAESRKWAVLWTFYDTLSALNTLATDDVGEWDTNLPQYFCDDDYYRRVRLAGWECIDTGLTNVKHAGSATINNDPWLKTINDATFHLYRGYYIRKWGGESGHEQYRTPFNLGGRLR
jgi:hypothetical protein